MQLLVPTESTLETQPTCAGLGEDRSPVNDEQNRAAKAPRSDEIPIGVNDETQSATRYEEWLDRTLDETFPASDPIPWQHIE